MKVVDEAMDRRLEPLMIFVPWPTMVGCVRVRRARLACKDL